MPDDSEELSVTYEPHEKPPPALTAGLGLQYALLSLSGMILIPMVIFRAAQAPEALLIWGVFASLVVCGLVTALHGRPLGRFGAGYVLITGTTGTAIALSVDALQEGGIVLLGSLVLVSSLFQFAFSLKLALFRRVFTPTVSGVVLMLIPVTVMPIVFAMLDEAPAGPGGAVAPLSALVTLVAMGAVMIRGTQRLRPWAPVIGIAAGSVVASFAGLYDVGRIVEASWVGIPRELPALGFDFGPSFLQLLPAFVLVFLVCTIRTVSGTLAIQGVSWRKRRAADFRAVQGAVAADAASNLLAGLLGTVPNGVRTTTVALTEFSGVAARRVGIVFGLALAAIAFFPKVWALVLAVPGPVIAAYITVTISLIFVLGMKMIVADGLDRRQVLIVGVSFWVGVGCDYGFIFPDVVPQLAGGLLNSGITAGGLAAIVLSGLFELTSPRRRRIETELSLGALPAIGAFVSDFAARNGWGPGMASRLDAASEETVLTLLPEDEATRKRARRLLLVARREGSDAVLEFSATAGEENIEDRLALLSAGDTGDSVEQQASLRLLRHHASEVRHRQYHDEDFITVRVTGETRN